MGRNFRASALAAVVLLATTVTGCEAGHSQSAADSCAQDTQCDADAGHPLGAACPEGHCDEQLYCKPVGEGTLCSADCPAPALCPKDAVCQGEICAWNTGRVGQPCDDSAPCHPGLQCTNLAQGAYCTRPCDYNIPCPQAENARCVRLSQGGNYCLRNCHADDDCEGELRCLPLTAVPEISVCFAQFN